MPHPTAINRLSPLAVTLIHAAFDSYQVQFDAVTRRAKTRFEARDWHGAQRDAATRLALYKSHIDQVEEEVRALLGSEATEPEVWKIVKAEYGQLVSGRDDCELAETFFNSVTRRIFATIGVDRQVEFVSAGGDATRSTGGSGERTLPTARKRAPARFPLHGISSYAREATTATLVQLILSAFTWNVPYDDVQRDAELAAAAIDAGVRDAWGSAEYDAVDIFPSVFYRNKGAYIVGRIRRGTEIIPLVLPLLNTQRGITVDAVLTTSDEASIVFGFSWSYFHVQVRRPGTLVDFLASIMPLKRVDELYTAIGYNKHGKTELYRSLLQHLEDPGAKFELAEGDRGMVMSVFTLPSFNVVFKIIKDRFGQPKRTTRRAVKDRYQFVFVRDRVGRLADAQEFEHLRFRKSSFSDALLAELLDVAKGSVRVEGDRVIVVHLYTERRVTPLNLYLRDADAESARDAVLDYGNAIKDLASSNIFTGDMLLKNFGVTRHGRVIFYDYDELCLLTECNFRHIPESSNIDDEYSAEPWFYVGENDVFPEEFSVFLVPSGRLREAFLAAHADLLDTAFWKGVQERQASGEVFDVFPYRQERRLTKGRSPSR